MPADIHTERCCWIYILECENNTLYTGYTTDIIKRYRSHLAGKVKYTRGFKPRKIAQCWRLLDTKGTAMKIEHYIKKLDRRGKLELIINPGTLQLLASEHLGSDINVVPENPALIEKAFFDKDAV
ncbi:MAG TPA: GIY-YIG nuclease family protein [Spirochaetota bacterium]|nr:GIY-YIG nuclease family protein [Spirochaetota bacterium]HQO01570.1 GIY-YIG nuclease family protein [Spirochaetota bacterium]